MGIEDVGVRFVTEGATQFEATMKRADKAVDNFGDSATKSTQKATSKLGGLFSNLGKQFNEFDKSLSGQKGTQAMKLAWGGLIGVAGTVTAALTAAGIAAKKLADDYMTYAFRVKDFGRIIGATPEEASRLIQVADDVRLSTESMTVAMRTAISKGFTPTVQGLGELSDAYLSIKDPLQRSRFLIETFGRSGLEMGKLMELGSKKIEEMGHSIDGTARLMTEKGIVAAQKYYDAIDKLTDATDNLKLAAGQKLIPILADFANELANVLEYANFATDAINGFGDALGGNKNALLKFATIMVATNLGYENAARLLQLLSQEEEKNAVSTEKARLSWAEAYQTSLTAKYGIDILAGAFTVAGNSAESSSAKIENLGVDISDLARQAQQTKISEVKIGLDFTFPNFADKMKNLMDSIDWQAAGGGALEKFMEGFASRVAPLTEDQKKKVAAQVGAVDVALRVNTGEITKWEGIQEIKDLFKEVGGIDTTAAQALIDKIGSMTVPDISTYLNDIVRLAAPETAAAAATNTSALDTSTKSLGSAFLTYNPEAKKWEETMGGIGVKAGESISNVQLLNAELAKIPENITVTVRIVTQGTIPKPRQTGGLTAENVVYLVGERGPELFIPGGSGTIVPNYQTMSMLGNMLTVIPMAKGGKMNAKQEKELVQREKRRKRARWSRSGGITEDTDALNAATEAEIDTADLTTAYDYAVSLLRFSVAEYNTLVKSGASKAILADKKATIDLLNIQVVELARLRQAAALQQALKNTGDKLPSGIAEAVPWIDKIIVKFKELFGLLTGTTATTALSNLSPYFNGNVSQLAGPNYYSTSSMRNYNINVPVTATVNNGTDISRLAYAVAKEIAANVRQ